MTNSSHVIGHFLRKLRAFRKLETALDSRVSVTGCPESDVFVP